jgi:hypothetical protein
VSARRGLIGFGTVLVVGLIALLVAGAGAKPTRAFSLDVPNVGPASTLSGGQRACEAPIPVPSAFGSLQIWASSIGGDALLAATVSDATSGRVLARGQTIVRQGTFGYPVELVGTVPAGRPVRICLTNTSRAPVYLDGSGQTNPAVHLTVAGKPTAMGISLVAVSPKRHSLLSQLSTVFARAALFRPGWVGQWTFWLLLIGVALAIVLVGAAVAAASADERRAAAASAEDGPSSS